MVSGETNASGVGSSEAASRFNNNRSEVARCSNGRGRAKFADEAVGSRSTGDIEPHTLHGDAHLVLTGGVGGLSDDRGGVPVGEGTGDTVATSVGSTALPEGSGFSVGFRTFDPLPETSGVLSTTEPARGSHLAGDEAVFLTGSDGSEVTTLISVDLFRAPLTSRGEVTRNFEVAVDVAVARVVVRARSSGPSDGTDVRASGGSEVVDGLQDGSVAFRSTSTFEAELTEGREPHLDDATLSQVGEVGAEDIHAARVAVTDSDSQAVDDAVGVLNSNTNEGLDGLATSGVGDVTSRGGVEVAVGVSTALGLAEFSALGSFGDAHSRDPSATVLVTVTVGFGDALAGVVSGRLTLVLVPPAVALLGAFHRGERSRADTFLVGEAGHGFEELGRIASSTTREGLLDDRALAVGAATTAVERALSPVAPFRVDAINNRLEALFSNTVPRASHTSTFAGGVVAAWLAVAGLGVVVVEALGAETAVNVVQVGAADSFSTFNTEFAAFISVGNAGFTSVEAARRDLALLSGSSPDAAEGAVADEGFSSVAHGVAADTVLRSAVISIFAGDTSDSGGDVSESVACSDATTSGNPVALILSGASEFSGEELALSCAVVSAVRSAREQFAHVAVVVGLDALVLDGD